MSAPSAAPLFVREKNFYKSLIVIALPVALQNLIAFGVNMLDTVMVGSLGEVALSATAMGNQVSTFLMTFIKGISTGAAVMISQYYGKKDFVRIRRLFSLGFQLSLGVSLLFSVVCLIAPETAMSIFVDDSAVIVKGCEYLPIIAISFVVFAVSENFIAMLRAVQIVRISLMVSVMTLLINVAGNYVFIYGKFGFPALGVTGAALATLLARVAELVLVAIYVLAIDKKLRLRFRDFFTYDSILWKDFARYGVALVVTDVLWGFVNTCKAMIMGRLGPQAMAANSISDVLLQLATMFVFGLAAGSSVLIGKSVGAREYDKTRQYAKTMQILFLLFGFVAGAATLLLRPFVLQLYDVEQATKDLAMSYMLFGAITIVGTSYAASCFQGLNRGAGDVRYVLCVNLICGYLVVLPLSYLSAFVFHFPAPITYLFTRCDQLVKMPIAFFRLRSNKWIRNVTRP